MFARSIFFLESVERAKLFFWMFPHTWTDIEIDMVNRCLGLHPNLSPHHLARLISESDLLYRRSHIAIRSQLYRMQKRKLVNTSHEQAVANGEPLSILAEAASTVSRIEVDYL